MTYKIKRHKNVFKPAIKRH